MSKAVTTLLSLLNTDIATLQQLSAALNAEREALQTRDLKALEASQALKVEALHRFEQNRAQQRHFLARTFKGGKCPPLRQLIAALKDNELNALYQAVETHFADCQRANEVNGKIIRYSQTRTRKVLEILCGKHSCSTLYGAEGETQSSGGKLMLAKA